MDEVIDIIQWAYPLIISEMPKIYARLPENSKLRLLARDAMAYGFTDSFYEPQCPISDLVDVIKQNQQLAIDFLTRVQISLCDKDGEWDRYPLKIEDCRYHCHEAYERCPTKETYTT